ncbi:MAG TPA: TIGR04282 family arsenosugar biosynthesis glycosyltransferase [Kofleriaceae bacterium]|nr:TIGR04282 family arsenosugar biosynthesis glycosyltransferase [Kofleriaceae bacterium]
MSSDRPVGVVIMAKRPRAGAVKTRLVPALGEEGAAALYAAMLADRCAQVRRLRGVIPAIAYAGDDGDEPAAAAGFEIVPQPAGGIGAGLAAAAEHFLARGVPVVMVDSDSAGLPGDYLQQAVDGLRGGLDLVLGPATDGGYYLIGLARPAPELFRDMPWSTPLIAGATLHRAAELGLATRCLPHWSDIDTPADLERLTGVLLDGWWPEQTAGWLRARRHAPPAAGAAPAADLWQRPWQRLSSRPIYATPWLRLREDAVIDPAGARTTYSVIEAGQCVGVLPFVDPDTVLLVRQFRYVAGRVTWEMPTGGVHAGESPEAAARRELAEEAQVAAGELEPLGAYHTSKSVMDETAHLYVARQLSPRALDADDEHEFVRAEPVPFARLLDWVRSGEVVDSMTIIAALRVALARAGG